MNNLEKQMQRHAAEVSELLQRLIELEVACSKLKYENIECLRSIEDKMNEKINRMNTLLQTIEILIASIKRLLIDTKNDIPV